MFEIKKANRSKVKLKIGLFGPSGSGKTMGALKLAKGLVSSWEKICVLDTENGSAALYSHLGQYLHCKLPQPFSPERYREAMKFIYKSHPEIECLIIDSLSHEWKWCLEAVEKIQGNSFTAWNKIKPKHNKMVEDILQLPLHVIVTARNKVAHEMVEKPNGKKTIEKMGLKNITDDSLDYEMTVAFKIYQDHMSEIDKDRTGIFDDIPFMISEETGEKIAEWNNKGESECETIQKLRYKLLQIGKKNKGITEVENMFDFDAKKIPTMPKEVREDLIKKLEALEAQS